MTDGFQQEDLVKWVMGALFSLVTGVGWFWLHRVTERLDSMDDDFAVDSKRVSVLETKFDSLTWRLNRIETKLDILIDKKQ